MTRGYHHWRQALAGSTALIAVSLAASLALADGGGHGGLNNRATSAPGGTQGQPGTDAPVAESGGGGGAAGANGGSGGSNPGSGGSAG
ncbi:hypothetical protein FQU96_36990, partial [Reyranella sp. CPCC 100927]